jgi:hypothetical protein
MKMNTNSMKCAIAATMASLAGCGDIQANIQAKSPSNVNVKETVVTNADGTVTRTKKEEREIKDANGNVIGHETSVYSETVSADQAYKEKPDVKGDADKASEPKVEEKSDVKTEGSDTFLGLKFGEVPEGAQQSVDVPGEGALKMFKFSPARKLKGFDEYFAFVSPKTHKLVKVCACAKNAIDSDSFGRRHYLVEALESRYKVPARLSSWIRPFYVLDIAPGRGVSICLEDASDDYETVITAWDEDAARLAASELRELRDEAYRKVVEEHSNAIKEAAGAF